MTRPHAPRTKQERRAAEVVRRVRRGIASDVRSAREDAGLSLRHLAESAGVSASTIRAIEQDDVEPSLQVLARLSVVLGLSLGLRLYPGTGPLIRDHLQAAMISAVVAIRHDRWKPRLEVAVYRPVRGVIDLVLDDTNDGTIVSCEAQSELRRLEQQVRWARAKSDALGAARGESGPAKPVSQLLLLRSTTRMRAIVAQYADLVAAAYPARAHDAYAALTTDAPWPGDSILWCRVEGGQATILERPPRGINVGR